MEKSTILASLLLLPILAASGCREKCASYELRYGDKCILKPDSGTSPDEDASQEESVDARASDNELGGIDGEAPELTNDGETEDDTPAPQSDAGEGAGDASDDNAEPGEASPCTPNPCQHNGVCMTNTQGVRCDCIGTGYEGTRCEAEITRCTGEDLCFSPYYPCIETSPSGYTCQGQFADWHMPDAVSGAQIAPSYDVSSQEAVRDNVTGLIWQRMVDAKLYTWMEAKLYCESLALTGKGNWRLPTKIELESIVDHTRIGPSVDPVAFPGTPSNTFTWSSSPYVSLPDYAWYVYFYGGGSAATTMSTQCYVRCVRQPDD